MAVSVSVMMALFATLASCTDAATIMLKASDNTLLKTKGSGDGTAATSVLKASSETFNFNAQNFSIVANITDAENDDGTTGGPTAMDEDALSAVWYLAAFGGLVMFFFVVTCSELFFGNPAYLRQNPELPNSGCLRRHVYGIRNQQHHGGHYGPETPPPAYHLFAPPSYDDTVKDKDIFTTTLPKHYHLQQHGDKKLADVYVVPVHHGGATMTATSPITTMTAVVDAKLLAAVLPAQTKSK